MKSISLETAAPLAPKIPQIAISEPSVVSTSTPNPAISKKNAIRISLRASTIDALFAAIFSMTTTNILLSNFLVELNASPVVVGMLSSIPMLVNLIQPLGAYLSECTTSRFRYSLLTNASARLLWLFLVIGIAALSFGYINSQQLIILTLVIVLFSHMLAGLGTASWLSWMALLVPRQLRGRFFGLRNSAASLTNLIYVPLAGMAISKWPGGTLQGYGVLLLFGIVSGLMSFGCQYFQVDVNPRTQHTSALSSFVKNTISKETDNSCNTTDIQPETTENHIQSAADSSAIKGILKNSNFLIFLLYFSLRMLACNLSAPYFNFYMLETMHLDVSLVTVYGSLQAGANLLMLIVWGKLSDKVGNRPILILVGILLALIPLFWLGIDVSFLSIWLWLPLLHMLIGATWSAVDLCSNNIQLSIAPVKQQSIYFATAAAVGGISGALGTTIGGLIAQNPLLGSIPGVFAVSFVFRLGSIIPLLFVQEPRGNSFTQMIQTLWIFRKKVVQN
ncbi:MFS transporter [Brasilonema sp. UFV-L1]|uniref:MFS transporter n=1 Tax=Brasilonema sp. UFV-L1 TaxID=2234130 RepID=UPI00145F50D8|nr:MFS transporter [Brasilonema sp. UFV-L1]NMG07081.1 MFS transporter [Brasilonema sp. UFV-L1]